MERFLRKNHKPPFDDQLKYVTYLTFLQVLLVHFPLSNVFGAWSLPSFCLFTGEMVNEHGKMPLSIVVLKNPINYQC